MEKQKFHKTNNLGIKIILMCIVAIISSVYLYNVNSDPFDPIKEMRGDMVSNYELIGSEKAEMGTIIYSVGQVNNGKDNMYFIDMVKKSLLGYKWVGGGGHINRDLGKSEDFIFSTQLLNEKQNIIPTIFGVFTDQNIIKITVRTNDNILHEAIISKGKGTNEKFYHLSFNGDISNYIYFIYTVIYENGNKAEYIVSENKDLSNLQKGRQIYFY